MAKLIEIKFITILLNMLTEKKIEELLRSIKKNIKLNSKISDQLDSIQFLNLIIKLEQNFKVKIPESKIKVNNFKNIKNIKKMINEKRK
jgi:acyl carrier protein